MSSAGCWALRLPSVIVRVNSRLRGGRPRPTITNECCRFILVGTLPPDPQIVEPVTAADQMPDNRLTVPAGPLGQLADPRPGPKTALSRPGRSRPCTEPPRTPGPSRQLHLGTSREHLADRPAAAIYRWGRILADVVQHVTGPPTSRAESLRQSPPPGRPRLIPRGWRDG